MTGTPPLVTIFGGSGFIGRYIARRMAKRGWRVRVAVRRPNDATFVRPYGDVGQVEPVQANIRDEASVRRALRGADAVVLSVGVLYPSGRQTFEGVQAEGAARVARIAAEEGVGRFVHVSAIGADPESPSEYGRTKAKGEAAVLAAFPQAVILRPSIVFGPEDEFFNRFAGMARLSPILPVVGAETKFQPVWVDDVAQAAEVALTGSASGIYELGGPEVETFEGLMQRMLAVIRRRRLVLPLPAPLARIQAGLFSLVEAVSFGLLPNRMITGDQITLLERDNVVAPGAKGLADLGIRPTAMASILESYLYPYRPYGQFTEITETPEKLPPRS